MTSEIFAWIWLPGHTRPTLAGRLVAAEGRYLFQYSRRYLEHRDAIPIFWELPLQPGVIEPAAGLTLPGCLRDAAPDAWGRRIIEYQHGEIDLDETVYLLDAGSDRVGALDFGLSPTRHTANTSNEVSLETFQEAVHCLETDQPLPEALKQALLHGTSIGGARPKMLLEDDNRKWIAKFSLSTDRYPVVRMEYLGMRLAQEAGIETAHVKLEEVGGKDILLVERFDRENTPGGWQRKPMVSALTVLGIDEMMARYASYKTLADICRARGRKEDTGALFTRLVFNIIIGNTDDHARNHAFFWDGEQITLVPAYDICPQGRTGRRAGQAMSIDGRDNRSQLSLCIEAAMDFLLDREEARRLVLDQVETVKAHWDRLLRESRLAHEEERLRGKVVLSPYIVEDMDPDDPIRKAVMDFSGQ